MGTSPSGLGAVPSGTLPVLTVGEPDGRWSDLGSWAGPGEEPGPGPGPGPEPDPATLCARTDPVTCGHPRSAHDPECSECECQEFEEPVTPSYQAMTVSELKDELSGRGLSTSGNKGELIERLEANDLA